MLRIAVIGTGNISGAHIQGYLAHPDQCRIVAMADVVPGKAAAKASELGLADVVAYESATAMLAAEDLDLVTISTPPDSHAALTVEALDAGVNVLVEKPMAPSLAECDAMLAAAERSGKLLSVVAQNRFRNDMRPLKAVLESGLLGDVSHVQMTSAWWRSLSYYDLHWRGRWQTEGGGCTLNHAIHHIDLLLWLMGSSPTAVSAMLTNAAHENSEVEDLSVAVMRYGRALAELASSVVHHGEEQGITIHGRDAMIAQPWRVVAAAPTPAGFPPKEPNTARVEKIQELRDGVPPLDQEGHAGQIGDVLSAVAEGRSPAITGRDGRATIELVTAIYKSGIEGALVPLPIAADDAYASAGTLTRRAPRFYEKSGYAADLGDGYVVGSAGS
jgi:predicted dehydrogenase